MQTIVLYLCYIVLILLFSTAYNTSLIYCFGIWCLHTNKRRPCSSTLSGHPSSSLKTDRKAAARWPKGIWLGKSLTNDTHIIAQGNNVFVTRSIRRLPTPFVLEGLGEVVACPGDYGYAALGHRLV